MEEYCVLLRLFDINIIYVRVLFFTRSIRDFTIILKLFIENLQKF